MKKLSVLSTFIALAFATTWFFYPISIPADFYYVDNLEKEQYAELKNIFLRYKKENANPGISVSGDSGSAGSMAMYCRDLNLILLSDMPGATTLMVTQGAYERAAGLEEAVNEALKKMKENEKLNIDRSKERVSKLDAFVLKYRDSINMESDCR
jgi:hypothetical protein